MNRLKELSESMKSLIAECKEKENYMLLIKLESTLKELLDEVDRSYPI